MNISRINYYLFVVSFAIISCKENYYSPREIIANTNVPLLEIELEELNIESTGAEQVLAVDSLVVVMGSDNTAMIQVYDYSGKQLARLSPSGRAKNEYLSVQYANQTRIVDGDRYIYLLDGMKNEYSMYNLSASIRLGHNANPKVLHKREPFIQSVFFREDGSYFSYKTMSYDDARDLYYYPPEFTLVKANGKKKKFDIIPDMLVFPGNEVFANQFFHYMVRMSDDGKKVVVVSSYEDRMTFINLESYDCFGVRCKDFVDITKYTEASVETISKKCIEGVGDVVVSNDLIFVLYDNRTVYEVEVLESPKKSTIRVFNWDGDYLAELKLNIPLFDMSIDFDNQILLGIDEDERIYKADLSTFLSDYQVTVVDNEN